MNIKKFLHWVVCFAALGFSLTANATLIIPMYSVDRDGQCRWLGTVRADDTIYGVLFQPNLRHLPAGIHGFHVHACPECGNFGRDAGGHLDPQKTNAHLGPYRGGHLGDLPVLIVNSNGRATLPVLAPRLKLSLIEGRSLIIDECGDNYSDEPLENGGGGVRIACGVIGYEH